MGTRSHVLSEGEGHRKEHTGADPHREHLRAWAHPCQTAVRRGPWGGTGARRGRRKIWRRPGGISREELFDCQASFANAAALGNSAVGSKPLSPCPQLPPHPPQHCTLQGLQISFKRVSQVAELLESHPKWSFLEINPPRRKILLRIKTCSVYREKGHLLPLSALPSLST